MNDGVCDRWLPDDMMLEVLACEPVIVWMRQRLDMVNRRLCRLLRTERLWHAQHRAMPASLAAAPDAPLDDGWRALYRRRVLGERELTRVLNSVVRQRWNVFVTGGAGTGKTHALHAVVARLRRQFLHVAVTASTGTAAVPIGGTTLHQFAGVGLGNGARLDVIAAARTKPTVCNRWQETDVLVIDEVSMVPPAFFELLDALARDLRGKAQRPFGGMQVVLFGDFLQLTPVGTDGGGGAAAADDDRLQFCFQTDAWRQCVAQTIVLEQVHRQHDLAFVDMLQRVRRARHTAADVRTLKTRVQAEVACDVGEPTRMFPHRASADRVNAARLEQLQGPGVRYQRTTGSNVPDGGVGRLSAWACATRQRLRDRCPAPEVLELRCGAQVMLVVNRDVDERLVNGSRGVVVGFASNGRQQCPMVRFEQQPHPIMVDAYPWKEHNGSWFVSCKQIPLILAWAITIHKSQGASLDATEVDLGRGVFAAGQSYVALSRLRSFDRLRLLAFDERGIRAHPRVLRYYDELESGGGADDAARAHSNDNGSDSKRRRLCD